MTNDTSNRSDYIHTNRPQEIVVYEPPKKKHGKRNGWFLKITAYMVVLTFISGMTFGAGYFTASQIAQTQITETIANNQSNITLTSTTDSTNNIVASDFKVADSSLSTASDGSNAITAVAENVGPSVVTIVSYAQTLNNSYFSSESSDYTGTGSGVIFQIVDDTVHLVTNFHVIEGAKKLEVVFHDGATIDAQVVGYDSNSDIAVLSMNLNDVKAQVENIVVAQFGDSDQLKVGQTAIAIGNPLGPNYNATVTSGIISALGRDISIDRNTNQLNLIQTDAAINPGNSGGALLNINGHVIGINSAKYVDESVEGIGFAIPINDATQIIQTILDNPNSGDTNYQLTYDRAFLGLQISEITAEIYDETGMRFGAYITGVFEGSGADEAGIKEGDIIYTVDQKQVRSVQGLFNILSSSKVGDIIEIGILRGNDLLTIKAPLYSYKEVMDKQQTN